MLYITVGHIIHSEELIRRTLRRDTVCTSGLPLYVSCTYAIAGNSDCVSGQWPLVTLGQPGLKEKDSP